MGSEVEGIQELIGGTPPVRLYVAAAGAGATLQGRLWAVPGVSSFLVGGSFPYDQGAIADFLGYMPEKFVTDQVALDFSHMAFLKALTSKREGMPIGIGITASVAGTREHRGDHRAFIAVTSPKGSGVVSLLLQKGVGFEARQKDEDLIVGLALRTLFIETGVKFEESQFPAPTGVKGVYGAEEFLARPYFHADGSRGEAPKSGQDLLLVPGTFNPVHVGHFGIAKAAALFSGRTATFYITLKPPHKPAIGVYEALSRVPQFKGKELLFGWDDALYIEKARKYPGAAFVIGTDALDRMLDPQWGPVYPMIREFLRLSTRFYVADRVSDGKILRIEDVMRKRSEEIAGGKWNPVRLETLSMFKAIPGSWDVSSTQIRAQSSVA